MNQNVTLQEYGDLRREIRYIRLKPREALNIRFLIMPVFTTFRAVKSKMKYMLMVAYIRVCQRIYTQYHVLLNITGGVLSVAL